MIVKFSWTFVSSSSVDPLCKCAGVPGVDTTDYWAVVKLTVPISSAGLQSVGITRYTLMGSFTFTLFTINTSTATTYLALRI